MTERLDFLVDGPAIGPDKFAELFQGGPGLRGLSRLLVGHRGDGEVDRHHLGARCRVGSRRLASAQCVNGFECPGRLPGSIERG